jgi:hypothetical protein
MLPFAAKARHGRFLTGAIIWIWTWHVHLDQKPPLGPDHAEYPTQPKGKDEAA